MMAQFKYSLEDVFVDAQSDPVKIRDAFPDRYASFRSRLIERSPEDAYKALKAANDSEGLLELGRASMKKDLKVAYRVFRYLKNESQLTAARKRLLKTDPMLAYETFMGAGDSEWLSKARERLLRKKCRQRDLSMEEIFFIETGDREALMELGKRYADSNPRKAFAFFKEAHSKDDVMTARAKFIEADPRGAHETFRDFGDVEGLIEVGKALLGKDLKFAYYSFLALLNLGHKEDDLLSQARLGLIEQNPKKARKIFDEVSDNYGTLEANKMLYFADPMEAYTCLINMKRALEAPKRRDTEIQDLVGRINCELTEIRGRLITSDIDLTKLYDLFRGYNDTEALREVGERSLETNPLLALTCFTEIEDSRKEDALQRVIRIASNSDILSTRPSTIVGGSFISPDTWEKIVEDISRGLIDIDPVKAYRFLKNTSDLNMARKKIVETADVDTAYELFVRKGDREGLISVAERCIETNPRMAFRIFKQYDHREGIEKVSVVIASVEGIELEALKNLL